LSESANLLNLEREVICSKKGGNSIVLKNGFPWIYVKQISASAQVSGYDHPHPTGHTG